MMRRATNWATSATRLVWENDRVRIWEMVLEPGERSAVHEHTLDYLLVPLAGDRIGVEVEPDTAGAYRESADFPVPVGKAHFVVGAGSRPRSTPERDLPRDPHRVEGRERRRPR